MHSLSQQTPSTQKLESHSAPVAHAALCAPNAKVSALFNAPRVFRPPATSTLPLKSSVAVAESRCVDIFASGCHFGVLLGSYSSAAASSGGMKEPKPPAMKTRPLGR